MYKNIVKLLSGNILAQVTGLLSLPLITLLYLPEHFGQLGLVVSVASILLIACSFKLDVYLVLCNRRCALSIMVKALSLCFTLSFVTSFIACLFLYYMAPHQVFLNFQYLDVLFIFILINSTFFSLCVNSLLLKVKRFNELMLFNFFKALVLVCSQLTFSSYGYEGLVISEFFSRLAVIILGVYPIYKEFKKKNLGFIQSKRYIKNSIPFMKFNMPSGLVSSLNVYMPVLFVSSTIDNRNAGLYFMAIKLILVPASMISTSISKVYISEMKRSKAEAVTFYFLKRLTLLALIVVGSFNISLLILPESWVPSEWFDVLNILPVLSLILLPMLCVSSISQAFNLVNLPKELFKTELVKLCFMFFVLFTVVSFSPRDFEALLYSLVLASYLGYGYQLKRIIHVVK